MQPVDTRKAAGDPPTAFRTALAGLRAIRPRPEVELLEAPAPQRLAPYAVALTADLLGADADGDIELATGRFVLLHDPAGQDAWQGTWRVVVFAKAHLEPEMGRDEILNDVGWSWLVEALQQHTDAVAAFGGTVTSTSSQPYGAMAGRPPTGDLEIRASWTPTDDRIVPHATAWLDLLAQMVGLEPVLPGISALRMPGGTVPRPPSAT